MVGPQPDFTDPFEECEWMSARELFRRLGFEPMPPHTLDDAQIPGRLWEFIYAMAARRFYLYQTNHLSDRELYIWLHDKWLVEETPNIPPDAEWNCHIDVAESDAGYGLTVWLRFYADESERERWVTDFPEDILPPHEDLPYDRDRLLPDAPIPIETHAEELLGDDGYPEVDGEDLLGLAKVDQEIAQMRDDSELEEEVFESESSSAELESQLRASEPENWIPAAQQLAKENVPLLPPAEVTDEMLAPILWELLHNLACRGFFVLHTNHMSDRELYGELWTRGLRDPAYLPGRNVRGGWFHDCIGSGSEEDIQLSLRYYDTEEERANHARQWPDDSIPPKEIPPFNRDWRLPKGPF